MNMNINKKSAMALLVGMALLAASALASAQEQGQKKEKKAWEIGAGVSGMNYVRTTVYDFEQLSNGEYRFKLEDKHLYGGPNLYVARELTPWLYVDAQGTFGIARYRTDNGDKMGYSILVGPGLQFRPFTKSDWIVPYARVGINYFWKNFDAVYIGKFKNDPTGQAKWEAEDEWNKSLSEDKDRYIPVTAGLGVIGWVSNRIGIGIQADYNYDLGGKGKNFAQGTARLIYRFGGKDKRRATAEKYYAGIPEKIQYVEKIVEKPVEVEKIVEKEIPSKELLAEIVQNVNFDFDKDIITSESAAVLDTVADVISHYPKARFLIAGYTDARGTESYNEDLSIRRAKAVYQALVDRGVNESQLVYRGFGKRNSLVPYKASHAERRGDRKVVLEVVTDDMFWNFLKSR